MGDFLQNFGEYMSGLGAYLHRNGGLDVYSMERFDIKVVAVPLDFFRNGGVLTPEKNTMYVYEDRWKRSNRLMISHIATNIGMAKRVFARNCEIKAISAQAARIFMDEYHIYGSAKTEYHYGLFRRRRTSVSSEVDGEIGELVAAATFSSPRTVTRMMADGTQKQVLSYEWVRYASISGLIIVGGMGKLLRAFTDEIHPEDVMSYADLEWSDGKVYDKLGFKKIGQRAPITFLVNPDTMERIAEQRIGRDRKYKEKSIYDGYIEIRNIGSDKYFLRVL